MRDYDNWKLSTPWDNEPNYPEIFKTKNYDYYSMSENKIDTFDKVIKNFENKPFDGSIYDSKEEFLEETAENLADDLNLFSSEESALIEFLENEQSEKEYALECRYEEQREMMRFKDD